MRVSIACMAAGLASLATAYPVDNVEKRNIAGCADKKADPLPPVISANDEAVAELALYLEHLEIALYTGGYENFSDKQYMDAGFPAGFRENVGLIAQVWPSQTLHIATIAYIRSTK